MQHTEELVRDYTHSQYNKDFIICIQDNIIFVKIYSHFKVEISIALRERGRINLLIHNVINNEENIYVLAWELTPTVRTAMSTITLDCSWLDGTCIKPISIQSLSYSTDH